MPVTVPLGSGGQHTRPSQKLLPKKKCRLRCTLRGSGRQSARVPVALAPSRTDVPMAALPPPRSVRGLFLVFGVVPCFWAGRGTLKGVNFRPIRPVVVGQEWGPAGTWRGQELETKLGELVTDGARTREKCAKTMHIMMVNTAEACSFCAVSRAGRSIPATAGRPRRVPAAG